MLHQPVESLVQGTASTPHREGLLGGPAGYEETPQKTTISPATLSDQGTMSEQQARACGPHLIVGLRHFWESVLRLQCTADLRWNQSQLRDPDRKIIETLRWCDNITVIKAPVR